MRVALFTSGGQYGEAALRFLLAEHEVAAVVRPRHHSPVRGLLRDAAVAAGFRAADPVDRLAQSCGLHVLAAERQAQARLACRLARLQPDAICIAAFPWLLRPELLELAPLGGVNLHPSLLPRHRGPNPWFWVYYHDDQRTGVTAHVITRRADAGAILARREYPLERGAPLDRMYTRSCECVAPLLREALPELAGRRAGVPQNEAEATIAPRVPRRRPMVDFAAWDVERVWHFLRGMFPHFVEPLRDQAGRMVRYGGVLDYVRGDVAAPPGTVRRAYSGWEVVCRGGIAQLAAARPAPPAAAASSAC
jgi:methionyl-tRNA formyltransferase